MQHSNFDQLIVEPTHFTESSSPIIDLILPGRVAQSVTCLATDAYLTADPGVASSIPIRSHTFMEIDHEMISTVILPLRLIHSKRALSLPSIFCSKLP